MGKNYSYDQLAEDIVAQLIEMIETEDVGSWTMPWHRIGTADHFNAGNPTNGIRYRGANSMALFVAGVRYGYTTAQWATYRQWKLFGAQVRRGEEGSYITKWIPKTIQVETEGGDGETEDKEIFMPRTYKVFNADQVDGYDPVPMPNDKMAGHAVQDWVDAVGADVTYGSNRAFYSPTNDKITMPAASQFRSVEGYFGTMYHEHIHWTGHADRLAREFGRSFGDETYAKEELVAELGAAIGCGRLGIQTELRDDHAAYLKSWLKAIKAEPKELFRAAAAAQKAVDLLEKLAGDYVTENHYGNMELALAAA